MVTISDWRETLHVQNVVSTCNVGSTLYLPTLVNRLPSAEYNVRRFAAVTCRLVEPRTTALFFGSGKVVCTGARTKNEARLSLLKYIRMIRRIGLEVGVYDFEVQNIVATAGVPFDLDLPKMLHFWGAEASYQPELFPGLVYRRTNRIIVALLFRSGRIVFTGAKCKDDIERVYHSLWCCLWDQHEGVEHHTVTNALEQNDSMHDHLDGIEKNPIETCGSAFATHPSIPSFSMEKGGV